MEVGVEVMDTRHVRSTVAYDEVSLSPTESIQHERDGGGKSDIGL